MRIGIFTLFFHDIGIGLGAYFRGLVIDLTSSYAVLFRLMHRMLRSGPYRVPLPSSRQAGLTLSLRNSHL